MLYENEDLYEDGGCFFVCFNHTVFKRWWLYEDMHQDQGDASQVNKAYAYAYRKLYIYRPLALEIERINQVNQKSKKC